MPKDAGLVKGSLLSLEQIGPELGLVHFEEPGQDLEGDVLVGEFDGTGPFGAEGLREAGGEEGEVLVVVAGGVFRECLVVALENEAF